MSEQTNDMASVIEAARQGATPLPVPGADHTIFLPLGNHGQGEIHNLEPLQPTPRRKRGSVTVFDAASLNQIIADNKDAGDVSIYLDRNPEKPSIVAILNGHGPAGPGWGDFRAQIAFRPTPQWLKWKAVDGRMLPQTEFAEFIEDNLDDISDPAGAAMLEIVTYLQATKTTNFKSGVRLNNGAVQFQNLEDVNAQVGAGQIAVPETFTLAISPVFGIPHYAVPARFRYRIQDGKLKLGFKLQRVETLMSQIVEDVIAKIERGTHVSVFEGLPPAL